jgi:hypothetical protein
MLMSLPSRRHIGAGPRAIVVLRAEMLITEQPERSKGLSWHASFYEDVPLDSLR